MSIIEKAVSRLDASAAARAAENAAVNHGARSAERHEPTLQHETPRPLLPEAAAAARQEADLRNAEPQREEEIYKIDLDMLRSKGIVTPDTGRTAVAEEFRAIKRPLLARAFEKNKENGQPNNLIMVTSSLPREGKTFCSINLALSIAMELDRTVLLVDADVARPSVLNTLGLKAEAGLMDVLQDRVDLQEVLLRTNVESLSILPAGKNHRHATEILASHGMTRLLSDLATRYKDRIIIFDSPPLLLTTESRVLASQMGQIVMVVEAETTTQHAVKNALRQLEGCANVNLVYNKSKAFLGAEEYGSYYN